MIPRGLSVLNLIIILSFLLISASPLQAGSAESSDITAKNRSETECFALGSRMHPTSAENKTVHEGDITVEGNETLIIEGCEYLQDGNIVLKDNATLIVINATLILKSAFLRYRITVEDNAQLRVIQSNLTSIGYPSIGKPIQSEVEVYLTGSSKTIITQSVASAYFKSYDSSSLVIVESEILPVGFPTAIYAYNSSSIIVNSSVIMRIEAFDFSSVIVVNSTVDGRGLAEGLFVSDFSNVLVDRSRVSLLLNIDRASVNLTFSAGSIKRWSLRDWEAAEGIGFNLTLLDTQVAGFGLFFWNSEVSVRDSNITLLGSLNSTVSIKNSTVALNLGFMDTSASVVNARIDGQIGCVGNSTVHIYGSTVNNTIRTSLLFKHGKFWYPSVKIINSTVSAVEHEDGSMLIINSEIARFDGMGKNATIVNSKIGRIIAKRVSSTELINTQVDSLEVLEKATDQKGWFLTVTVALDGKALEGALVEVYDGDNLLVSRGITGSDGSVNFTLPEVILQPGMKTEYVGNYTIKVIHEKLVKEEKITLNANKNVTINLESISSSEFPQLLALYGGITASILAVTLIALKWKRKQATAIS